MNLIPDVVGFQLDDALDRLKKMDVKIDVHETFSPKVQEKNGECRVIKQINTTNNTVLTVSYF